MVGSSPAFKGEDAGRRGSALRSASGSSRERSCANPGRRLACRGAAIREAGAGAGPRRPGATDAREATAAGASRSGRGGVSRISAGEGRARGLLCSDSGAVQARWIRGGPSSRASIRTWARPIRGLNARAPTRSTGAMSSSGLVSSARVKTCSRGERLALGISMTGSRRGGAGTRAEATLLLSLARWRVAPTRRGLRVGTRCTRRSTRSGAPLSSSWSSGWTSSRSPTPKVRVPAAEIKRGRSPPRRENGDQPRSRRREKRRSRRASLSSIRRSSARNPPAVSWRGARGSSGSWSPKRRKKAPTCAPGCRSGRCPSARASILSPGVILRSAPTAHPQPRFAAP